MWGAAPRPGREKFSLHPRHVRWTCLKDVAVESNGYAFTHSGLPVALAARSVAVEGLSLRACTLRFLFSVLRGAKRPFPAPPARLRRAYKHAVAGRACAQGTRPARGACRGMAGFTRYALGTWRWRARRTENGACRREAPNLPRLRRTERPCGATAEGAVRERCSRSPIRPICPIGPTAKFDDVSRRVKREDDGREGAISGRLARKATGVSPSGFARTGVFAENESVNTNQPISQALSGAPASLRKIVTEQ